jgi:hypothetical protein
VQFFAWLLVLDKIHSRHNLHKKHIVEHVDCELCSHADETANHIVFGCTTASAFREHLGARAATSSTVRDLWSTPMPVALPQRHRAVFTPLRCWNL